VLVAGEVKSVLTLEEAAMRALRVVGLGEDGKIVICETDRGERFQIPADERLRAAARGDITRLGQIAIELESQMRPREIQTRIRAGESVEQVAAAAGVPPERVERFAYPVLLERSRTAELAQKAHPVREDGPDVQELGEVVAHAFGARGQDYSAAVWDSWKGEDGKWVVQLTWTAGRSNNHAHWSFHPGAHGGTVTPLDDHALDLLDPNPNRQLRTVRPVTELAAQALQVAEPVARRQAVNGGEPPRRVEEQDYVQDFELTDDALGQQQLPVDDPDPYHEDPYGRPTATAAPTRPREEYRRSTTPDDEYREEPPSREEPRRSREEPRQASGEESRRSREESRPSREVTRPASSGEESRRSREEYRRSTSSDDEYRQESPPREEPRRSTSSDEDYRQPAPSHEETRRSAPAAEEHRQATPSREETRPSREEYRPAASHENQPASPRSATPPAEHRPTASTPDTPAATHTAPPTEQQATHPAPARTASPAARTTTPSIPEEPTQQGSPSTPEPAAASTTSPGASPAAAPAQEEEPTAPRPAARPTMPTIDETAAPTAEETPAAAKAAEPPAPPAAPPAPVRKGKGRKARPSVPSWEDVLLGTRSNR
jgi:hypothetical protein